MQNKLQLAAFYRDAWHCRYCLEPVFFSPTIRALDAMAPDRGYYHPHGKTGTTVEVLTMRHAMALHRVPTRLGGQDTLENLETACWGCIKDDPNRESVRDIPEELRALNWDGFAAIYRHLPGADKAWVDAIGLAAENAP